MLRKFSTYNRKIIKIYVISQLLETNFQRFSSSTSQPYFSTSHTASVFSGECIWRCLCNIIGHNYKWVAILICCTKSSDYYM